MKCQGGENIRLTISPFFFLISRARHLDSRALSKLGVYIPKPELNSFFIRDDFEGKVFQILYRSVSGYEILKRSRSGRCFCVCMKSYKDMK